MKNYLFVLLLFCSGFLLAQTSVGGGAMLGEIVTFPTSVGASEYSMTVNVTDFTGLVDGQDISDDGTWVMWRSKSNGCTRYEITAIASQFSGEITLTVTDVDGGGNPGLGFSAIMKETNGCASFVASGGEFALQTLNQCMMSYYTDKCGGVGSGTDSDIKSITQTAHGLTVGEAIHEDAGNGWIVTTGTTISPTAIVLSVESPNSFTLATGGIHDTDFGLNDGTYYYQSDGSSPAVTADPSVSAQLYVVENGSVIINPMLSFGGNTNSGDLNENLKTMDVVITAGGSDEAVKQAKLPPYNLSVGDSFWWQPLGQSSQQLTRIAN